MEVNYDTINNDKTNDADEVVEIENDAAKVVELEDAITTVQTTKAGEVSNPIEAVGVVKAPSPEPQNDNAAALQRAYYDLYGEHENEYIENILQVNGVQWIQASGYISIWNRLQAADAEMISLLPIETVTGEADYDLSRLTIRPFPIASNGLTSFIMQRQRLRKSTNSSPKSLKKRMHYQQLMGNHNRCK